MRLFGTPVGNLTSSDLDALATSRASESRILDLKLQLPGTAAKDKKEFLADIVALANTVGGVVVYGVETERDEHGNDRGIAKRIAGLGAINPDKEKQRLLAMLHDGISPSLASFVAVQDIDVPLPGANGPVIALGVAQSLSRPHMVTFEGTNKFYRRSDSGKYQPDMAELRSLFLETTSWIYDAEAFRQGRLARVREGSAIPKLARSSGILIHVLPLGRLDAFLNLNGRANELGSALPPPEYYGFGTRYNLDGCVAVKTNHHGEISGYTQWFRFGGVEGYESQIAGHINGNHDDKVAPFWANHTAQMTIEFVGKAVGAMRALMKLDSPFVVMLSLFGLAGTVIHSNDYSRLIPSPFTEDVITLPPVILEEPEGAMDALLRPLFDIVWQAGGFPEAPKAFKN